LAVAVVVVLEVVNFIERVAAVVRATTKAGQLISLLIHTLSSLAAVVLRLMVKLFRE
jgi:hypothetical protein